jgi:hypothetical protein
VRCGTALVFVVIGTLVASPAFGTMALCLHCGEIHHGAWVPCDKCGFKPDKYGGNFMQLAIVFSDHHMSLNTLHNFGYVMKRIASVSRNDAERLFAFLKYVEDNYPGILGKVNLPDPHRERVTQIIRQLNLPVFRIEPGLD